MPLPEGHRPGGFWAEGCARGPGVWLEGPLVVTLFTLSPLKQKPQACVLLPLPGLLSAL